jgi:hypothetical protein
MKKVLGSLSPAYGMMTGEGAFGKLADSGLGGIIPTLISQHRRKKKDGTAMSPQEEAMTASGGMKKGGKVKMDSGGYVKAADGVAKKGKTKGRMC